MLSRRVGAAFLLPAIFASLTACSRLAGTTRDADSRVSPLVTVGVAPEPSDLRLLTGALSELDGCLMLDNRVAVWSVGAVWDDVNSAVELVGGRRMMVGESFAYADGVVGARFPLSGIAGFSRAEAHAVKRCVATSDATEVDLIKGFIERDSS